MSQTQTETIGFENTPDSPEDLERQIQEDKALIAAMFAGDKDAAAEFYEKYHRLATWYANKVHRKLDDAGSIVDRDDHDQTVFEYILERAREYHEKSNPTAPFKHTLSGRYLIPTVRDIMFNERHNVRLPLDVTANVIKMDAINNQRKFSQRPLMTDEEIAQTLDLLPKASHPDHKINKARDIKAAAVIAKHMASLDTGFSPARDDDRGNKYVLDERAEIEPLTIFERSLDEVVQKDELRRLISEFLDHLDDVEREVIELRYGFVDDITKSKYEYLAPSAGYTVGEVAEKLGMTNAKVKKIELEAITKLRKFAAEKHKAAEDRFSADPKNYAPEDKKHKDGEFIRIERTLKQIPNEDKGLAEYR